MMDIQKAISLLKRKIRLKDFVNSDYADGVDKELLGFACFALEELAQYRQLGTVNEIRKSLDELQLWHKSHTNERIKNPFANQSTLICHNCDHKDEYIEELESTVEEYEQIGTVDECRTPPRRPGTQGRACPTPPTSWNRSRAAWM